MFKHILVPTDLKPLDNPAVARAIELGRLFQADLTLVHAIETIHDTAFDELAPFYNKLEERASKRLAELTSQCKAAAVECRTEIVYGDRTSEILRLVNKCSIDLIVMESRPLSAEHHGFATLSQKIGVLAPCAVLLVRPSSS